MVLDWSDCYGKLIGSVISDQIRIVFVERDFVPRGNSMRFNKSLPDFRV